MSFKKNTLLNIYQIGRFTYTGEVINFLASMVLARLLLPEEYGFVAMIYVITNFATIFTGLGISSEIVRNNYRYTFHKAMLNLSMYIGGGVTIAIILLAWPLALFYGNNDLILPTIVVSFQFIFRGMNMVFYALVLKWRNYNFLGRVELISNVLANSLMILMAALKFSYWALIIPFIISDLYKLFAYKRKTQLPLKIYPFKYTRVAFKYSKSLIGNIMGSRIISYWSKNLDTILVGKNFGETSLGLYNRGYRFLTLTNKLFESLFGSILYANLQKLNDENGDVFKEYFFFIGLMAFMAFPIGLILIVFPKILVLILWGNDWIIVSEYLPYFGIIILTLSNFSNTETIYKIFYKEKLIFRIGAVTSAFSVASIVIGSFFSALMVAKLIAFTQVAIVFPMIIFYSFGYELKIKFGFLIKVYLPRMLLLGGVFLASWYNNYTVSLALLVLYLSNLLFSQKEELVRLKELLIQRFRKNEKKDKS